MKFFQKGYAFRCDVKGWATGERYVLSNPDHRIHAIFTGRVQPSTLALGFQAVFPASLAFPRGLVRELEVECDD